MSGHIFSSEAASRLGIGSSTLRKYAALLECRGYIFERGTNNGRIFRQVDLDLLTKLIDKVSNDGMKLDDAAAELIINEKHPSIKNKTTTQNELSTFIAQIKELEIQQVALANMNEALVKQVERLTEKIEERERDQQLLQLLDDKKKEKKRRGMALLRPLNVFGGKNL